MIQWIKECRLNLVLHKNVQEFPLRTPNTNCKNVRLSILVSGSYTTLENTKGNIQCIIRARSQRGVLVEFHTKMVNWFAVPGIHFKIAASNWQPLI